MLRHLIHCVITYNQPTTKAITYDQPTTKTHQVVRYRAR